MPSSPSALNLSQHQGLFSESAVHINDQNTGVSASASSEYSGLISFKIDWFDLLVGRGTLRSLLQHHSLNSLVLHVLYGPALVTAHAHWEDHSLDYMDLCWQSNVSAFQHTVYVCHSFPAKKQSSSDFMAAVTICNDCGAQEEEICHYFHLFPFYLP